MRRLPTIATCILLAVTALAADLRSTTADAAEYSTVGPSGGVGGEHFHDGQVGGGYSQGLRLVEIRIRSGAFIDAIQTVYVNAAGQRFESPLHGGTGGTLSKLTLAADEYVVRISGKHGTLVDSLQIATNKGRYQGWGGPGGQAHFVYNAPPGSRIQGFFGRAGIYIDAIGVIFTTP